jgi:WhiB family redox-sensing transcriptional regulator
MSAEQIGHIYGPRNWRHGAECLSEDPELFFPIGEKSKAALLQAAEAKEVCRRCEVLGWCLEWAIDNGQDHGIWGGMTETERRAEKKRRK